MVVDGCKFTAEQAQEELGGKAAAGYEPMAGSPADDSDVVVDSTDMVGRTGESKPMTAPAPTNDGDSGSSSDDVVE